MGVYGKEKTRGAEKKISEKLSKIVVDGGKGEE
jgi:hypothetical protein